MSVIKIPGIAQEQSAEGLSASTLAYLCQIVRRDSGIVLDDSKRYLLEARLRPLASAEGFTTIDHLCRQIQSDHNRLLRQKVVEAMTTNETLFFRDVAPFEALRNTILPELIERRGNVRRLSIWSAACSSGQEAYSLAMLLHEVLPAIHIWKVEILGTDIAEAVLERARRGRYFQIEVNRGLPVQNLVKYFRREHLDWELKPEIRSMVQFRTFNLQDDVLNLGSGPPFDLVFCRNVMIYFETDLKKHVLAGIRRVLAPDGYLLLGGAETVFQLDDHYQRRTIGPVALYQVKK